MYKQFLSKIFIPPFIVLLVHVAATILEWYEAVWWLDKPLHLLGGIAVGISSYYLIVYFINNDKLQVNWKPLLLLAIFAATALSAVSWEFMEFYLDQQVHIVMQPSVYDTITDLIMGMLGGMTSGTILTYIAKLKK